MSDQDVVGLLRAVEMPSRFCLCGRRLGQEWAQSALPAKGPTPYEVARYRPTISKHRASGRYLSLADLWRARLANRGGRDSPIGARRPIAEFRVYGAGTDLWVIIPWWMETPRGENQESIAPSTVTMLAEL
jgi:hypothetical protein